MEYTDIPPGTPIPGVCTREESLRYRAAAATVSGETSKKLLHRYGTTMYELHASFQRFLFTKTGANEPLDVWVLQTSTDPTSILGIAVADFFDKLASQGYDFVPNTDTRHGTWQPPRRHDIVRCNVTVSRARPDLARFTKSAATTD